MSEFTCSFCGKEYAREQAYYNHRCDKMIRNEEIKTIEGVNAYKFYKAWMRKNRRTVPPIDTFMSSQFFYSFLKFAKFVKKVEMPHPVGFIELMVSKDISPKLWTNDKAYSLFIEQYDKFVSVTEQLDHTVETLFSLADKYNCDISDIFNFIEPIEILENIKIKNLSPWLLLNSRKFIMFVQKMTTEQKRIFNDIVRQAYWKIRFQNNRNTVNAVKTIIQELDL